MKSYTSFANVHIFKWVSHDWSRDTKEGYVYKFEHTIFLINTFKKKKNNARIWLEIV